MWHLVTDKLRIGLGVLYGAYPSSNKAIQSQASSATTAGTTSTPFGKEDSSIIDTNAEGNPDTNFPPSEEDLAELPKPLADVDDFVMPLFDEDTFLNGYASREELRADFAKAAKSMANAVIQQNLQDHSSNHNNQVPLEDVAAMAAEASVAASASSASSSTTPQSKTVSSSLTNNQEKDADEADLVKNNDNYVHAAYGDYLVVWDRQGNMIAQENMPVLTTPAPTTASPTDATTGEGTQPVCTNDFFSQASVHIESLLLTDE